MAVFRSASLLSRLQIPEDNSANTLKIISCVFLFLLCVTHFQVQPQILSPTHVVPGNYHR